MDNSRHRDPVSHGVATSRATTGGPPPSRRITCSRPARGREVHPDGRGQRADARAVPVKRAQCRIRGSGIEGETRQCRQTAPSRRRARTALGEVIAPRLWRRWGRACAAPGGAPKPPPAGRPRSLRRRRRLTAPAPPVRRARRLKKCPGSLARVPGPAASAARGPNEGAGAAGMAWDSDPPSRRLPRGRAGSRRASPDAAGRPGAKAGAGLTGVLVAPFAELDDGKRGPATSQLPNAEAAAPDAGPHQCSAAQCGFPQAVPSGKGTMQPCRPLSHDSPGRALVQPEDMLKA